MITLYIKLQGAVRRLEKGKQDTYLNQNNKKKLVEKLRKNDFNLQSVLKQTCNQFACTRKDKKKQPAHAHQ